MFAIWDAAARRAWRVPLWVHALAYAVVLVVLVPLMKPDASFSNDEGAYATQAGALREGRWAYPYEAVSADPELRYFPIIVSTRRDATTDVLTYPAHPAYPRGLAVLTEVVGETGGLHIPALVGVWLAAIAAWFVAEELAPGSGRIAFWLVATGPLLVNAYVIWAHAPSAAIAGFTALAALRTLRLGPSVPRLAAVATGAAAGVLLRSEAVLFAGAMAVVLLLGAGRPRVRSALIAAVPATAGAVSRLAERGLGAPPDRGHLPRARARPVDVVARGTAARRLARPVLGRLHEGAGRRRAGGRPGGVRGRRPRGPAPAGRPQATAGGGRHRCRADGGAGRHGTARHCHRSVPGLAPGRNRLGAGAVAAAGRPGPSPGRRPRALHGRRAGDELPLRRGSRVGRSVPVPRPRPVGRPGRGRVPAADGGRGTRARPRWRP